MNKDAASFAGSKSRAEQAAIAPQRQMAHLPCRLASFLDGVELVVFPESSVENRHVTFFDAAHPVIANSRQIRSVEELFFLGNQGEADDGFLRCKAVAQRL